MWPIKPKEKKPPLFRVIFWMKSGARIFVICEKASVTYEFEKLTSWTIEGNQNGKILYLPCTEIEAITSEPIND